MFYSSVDLVGFGVRLLAGNLATLLLLYEAFKLKTKSFYDLVNALDWSEAFKFKVKSF